MTMAKAFSYRRISTPAQALGHGIQRQLEASRKYAEQHGLTLAEEDELIDLGISAYKGDNVAEGALGGFLAAVRDGRIPQGSALLVESLDRLSRQEVRKSLSLFLEVINAGVEVHTLTDNRVYTPERTEMIDLVASLMILGRAHEESKTKSLRVASAWSNKRKNAATRKLTARAPFWLKLSDDKKKFHVIDERARVIRSIFHDSADGIGAQSITRRLNKKRVPSFGSNNGWHESYVNRILRNGAVIGEFQPHRVVDGKRVPDGDPIKGYFPAIVDEQLFYKAQAGRAARRARPTGRKGEHISNLFSGLLRCHYCRTRMLFEAKKPGRAYLVCYATKRGLGCSKARWKYSDFEESFLSFVSEVDLASIAEEGSTTNKRRELGDRIAATRGEIAAVQRRMEKTYAMLDAGAPTEFITEKLKEMEARRIELRRTLEQAGNELAGLDREHASATDIRSLIEKVRGSGDYRLRSQVASRLLALIDTILVAPAGAALVTQRADAKPIMEQGRRYFVVKLKNGSFRIVFPHDDDPTRFDEQVIRDAGGTVQTLLPDVSITVPPMKISRP